MSMNSDAPTIPFVPVGYPLSYFADTEPFKTWLSPNGQSRNAAVQFSQNVRPLGTVQVPGATRLQGAARVPAGVQVPRSIQVRGTALEPGATRVPGGVQVRRPTQVLDTDLEPDPTEEPDTPTRPSEWTNHVRLEVFTSRQLYPGGPYEHIVEFTATQQIAIGLSEPKGAIALFGKELKKDEPPPRLRLRFIVEPKYGHLDQLDISGAVRFQLPHSLVHPVVERDGRWVNLVKRHVVLPLGSSTLTLRRGARPKLSAPLHAPSLAVRLAQSGLVASLQSALVDITGGPARPTLQFKKIRLVYLRD